MFNPIHNISSYSRVSLSFLYGISIILIPLKYSFTFVQSTLLLTIGYYDLISNRKAPFYNSWSIIVNMPISFVGWIEALGCDWGIDSIGGHLIYDAMIRYANY